FPRSDEGWGKLRGISTLFHALCTGAPSSSRPALMSGFGRRRPESDEGPVTALNGPLAGVPVEGLPPVPGPEGLPRNDGAGIAVGSVHAPALTSVPPASREAPGSATRRPRPAQAPPRPSGWSE